MNKIKFYYNGIKVNGGKLIKCFYSLENNKDNAPSVSICAKEYAGRLPKELKPVNDTDIMTDYFDKDRAYLKPGDEYYSEARRAALVKEIKHRRAQLDSDILYYTKRNKALPDYIKAAELRLAGYQQEAQK